MKWIQKHVDKRVLYECLTGIDPGAKATPQHRQDVQWLQYGSSRPDDSGEPTYAV